jgi:hypothetical protein
LHSIVRAARAFEEIDYYPRFPPDALKGQGRSLAGLDGEESGGDDDPPLVPAEHDLPLVPTRRQPGVETTTMCAHISTRRRREKLAEHLK